MSNAYNYNFLKDFNLNQYPVKKLYVTGGGAYKFNDLFKVKINNRIFMILIYQKEL